MASLAHCNSLDNSSEDYEVVPDDAPDTVVPFQYSSRSRSCSPFSRILPKAFGRKDAEPPHEQAVEQHSDKGPDKEELRAVAAAVRLDVQAKLGVPITTYNVVQGSKTSRGPGSAADYHIKVEVDEPLYKYVYIVVRSTAMGAVDLMKVTPSHS